jgi:glycosyltransferase involved in cell wall biosynthesis
MSSFVVEIVGWGVLKDELLKVIGREGLGMYVRLLGGMSRERVLEKYRTSDIFCLPTIRESGGTAILEAMSCGLPIITSDYGGPAYFVTQECGIKIPVTRHADYVEKLAGALGYLTENAAVRERMGIAARERAKTEFSLQALEKKVMSAYGMVMKESTPGRKYGGCL